MMLRDLRHAKTGLSCTVLAGLLASGCASVLPADGPRRSDIKQETPASAAAFQVVDVDDAVTRRLLTQRTQQLFSETLGNTGHTRVVGAGDVLEVWIWEAVPALLFSESATAAMPNEASSPQSGTLAAAGSSSSSHAVTLPDQVVDDDGTIYVPFAGRISVAGKTLGAIEMNITRRLRGKANQPEVVVRLAHSFYSSATVVGEVTTSTRVQLVPGNDRLLDALAAASGIRATVPVSKTMIQVTRGSEVHALPLESIIRDPRQNVPLQPGDVVTALFQPFAFTVLGASGKVNDEVPFEAQGISLAQALARSGGLDDQRSNPKGVFIFRFEPPSALDSAHQPTVTTPDGKVPVVYRLDLSDPRSFFLIQSFPINNKDVLYVSDAPSIGLQKFLNILVQAAYPVNAAKQAGF
jgi:polysaccharide export outer membrane protein